MRSLGVKPALWADRAQLDASVRLAHTLLKTGNLKRGTEADEFLGLCERNPEQIPAEFWTVRQDAGELLMRGAVLIAAAGRRTETSAEPLPESLSAVRREPPPRIWAPV